MTERTARRPHPVQLTRISPLEARLQELSEFYPQLIKDGEFDREIVALLAEGKTGDSLDGTLFGLNWPGKNACIKLLRQAAAGALLPRPNLSINFGQAKHVFITGENLEVMKLLQHAYYASFKMIYVEPPYNTGTDQLYIDDLDEPLGAYLNYLEKTPTDAKRFVTLGHNESRVHSRWLSMMYPRLFVARNLLATDGVIFVSIDDHEAHHLRMAMDEIFGPENFVCTFIWEKRYAPPPDTKDIGYVHENILCYRRSEEFRAALLPMTAAQKSRYKNPDNDPRGPWKAADYTCRYTKKERPNLYYAIRRPDGSEIWPKPTRVWACTREEHAKNESEGLLWWGEDGMAEVPAKKKHLQKIRQGSMPMSLLRHDEVGHTDEATKELRKWLPEVKVAPKPTRLLRRLMHIANVQTDDLVLDCLGRTGSLAEAVLDANEQDQVGARFVSIHLPEPLSARDGGNLADVALQRALKRMKSSRKSESEGLNVFDLSSSSFRSVPNSVPASESQVAEQLEFLENNVVETRTETELLYEILLRSGFPLTSSISEMTVGDRTAYSVAGGLLLVCLARSVTTDLLRELAAMKPQRIVGLDLAFAGSDELKINTILQMKNDRVEFRTI